MSLGSNAIQSHYPQTQQRLKKNTLTKSITGSLLPRDTGEKRRHRCCRERDLSQRRELKAWTRDNVIKGVMNEACRATQNTEQQRGKLTQIYVAIKLLRDGGVMSLHSWGGVSK